MPLYTKCNLKSEVFMNKSIFEKLFVLEMANNHDGSVEHGLKIIRQMAAVCKKYSEFHLAFKFQFRD